MGNPSLWPLYEGTSSNDIVIVQINPIERKGVPRTSRDILGRINEITFNASLLSELRAIDFVSRLIAAGRLEGTAYRDVHVHVIEDDKLMTPLDESSKMLVEPAFLDMLFQSGRKNAKTWLDQHFADIGARSTINLRAYFDVREVDLDTHPAEPAAPKQI
jgi:NTE family protein